MSKAEGKIYALGIGPGSAADMTLRACQALEECDVVVGYSAYIRLLQPLLSGKTVIESGMRQEVQRCRAALREAAGGRKVAIVSSGDAGIYGMAGLVLELAHSSGLAERVAIEIVPGVPAFVAAAAIAGSPIMNDVAVVSLSDLMTPWEIIEKRLKAAAQGDFVTCLYNPKSTRRVHHIHLARDIFLQCRSGETPCAILRNVSRQGQSLAATTLKEMLEHDIDMRCVVIIGNSTTRMNGQWMMTPRGYQHS